MMNKIMLGVLLVVIIGYGAVKATATYAQNNPTSIIQKLAQKFNVSETEVQQVFEANKTERVQQRTAEYETWLSQLVTDGKITDAQKQLILQKHAELQAKRQAQWQARQQERADLEAWAKTNDIDLQYVTGFGGMGKGMRGMGMPHGFDD